MLIIEIAATNGAHRNQTGNFSAVPDGWAIVPLELEAEAMGYLPYIDLTVSDGVVTAVAQGTMREALTDDRLQSVYGMDVAGWMRELLGVWNDEMGEDCHEA